MEGTLEDSLGLVTETVISPSPTVFWSIVPTELGPELQAIVMPNTHSDPPQPPTRKTERLLENRIRQT